MAAAISLCGLSLGGLSLTGCSALSALHKAVHDIRANKQTIDNFNTKLAASSSLKSFEVTYATSGSSPATVVYAVQPPNDVSFSDTPTSTAEPVGAFRLIENTSGEYSCGLNLTGTGSTSSTTSPAKTTCEKLGTADASERNSVLGFYTPAHWVTFLRDFSIAAGFAGDTVSSSTMSVNGFSLNCVNFDAKGEGTSTICSTQQGLLGYVKVASDSTSFSITSYSTSPAGSLFELPPGATITTLPPAPTSTS